MELGKMILEKLSQYNFLTNILPGTMLCILLQYIVGYDVLLHDYYQSCILFYFVGMVNGRFSSLVIEPVLKSLKLIVFAPYSDFIKAEKLDSKITILSQENNTYRSYVSVLILSFLALLYKYTLSHVLIINDYKELLLLLLLAILFVCAYRKQTSYVRKRVTESLETSSKKIKEE